MKNYVITTGLVFGLLTLVHIARIFFEGLHVLSDVFFVFMTLLSAGLSVWAWRLIRPEK